MPKPHTDDSRWYVTPVGKVRYGDDVFEPPAAPAAVDTVAVADRLDPEFVERFLSVVDELTDELMAAGNPDRAACRADAITLLIAVGERQRQDASVESPLNYLLMEERHKAAASLGACAPVSQAMTFMKV